DNRIWKCKEAERAGTKHQCRNRDESVGRVDIAAKQKPCDNGAKLAASEPPFVQQIEVAATPIGGNEAKHGNQSEQQDEDGKSGPIHDNFTALMFALSQVRRLSVRMSETPTEIGTNKRTGHPRARAPRNCKRGPTTRR